MHKTYFLTRQTAILLEDFIRDLKSGNGVYLLYGDEGVGKTRLLEELTQNRLQDVTTRWIDLQAGSGGALVDSSGMIEDIFARVKPGDVIVADHFETALKKTRHQLFLSWSTDGVDKQINLIIAGNTSYFNELRQLALQYHVRVQSFQLMPFSDDEAAAFLGFYLFPDRPIGKLSVPPLLRNQISMAQGNVGKMVEIAERAGDQISSEPLNDTASIRQGSRAIVGIIISLAIIIGASWYFLSRPTQLDEMPVAEVESSAAFEVLQQQRSLVGPEASNPASLEAEEVVDEVAAELVDEVADDTGMRAAEPVTDKPDEDAEKLASVDMPAPEDEDPAIATTTLPDEAVETPTAEPVESQAQEGTASDDEVALDGSQSEPPAMPVTQAVTEESAPSAYSPFERDLQTSLEWISSRDSKVGTLQVMLLSQKRFDERVFYTHLERLSEAGVDISKLRIFATYTGNQKVYSVVFGEFQSRGAASAAKADLPKILQEAAPIPRSVGGLMTEIQRLEGKN